MKKSRIQGTWFVMLVQLVVLLIWHFARPALLPDTALNTMGYYLLLIAQEAILFGIPALALRPWWSHGVHRSPHWRSGCVLALPAGVLLALLVNPLAAGWSSLLGMAPQEMPLPASPVEWLMLVLAMVIVPALVEEAYFRGGVLCGLARGVGGPAAFALTVVIFVLMHGRIGALPAHLACGVLFTLTMLRYGKLWPPILMHLCYNAVTLALTWTGVVLPWLVLIPVALALAGMMIFEKRRMVWCEHKPIDMVDATLGAITMLVLVFYFLVQHA